VSGDYDYYIRIAVSDTRDYERLLREQLYKIPGIVTASRASCCATQAKSPAPQALTRRAHYNRDTTTRMAHSDREGGAG
jgi:DNA-binding Lrp family transcriptional regulator